MLLDPLSIVALKDIITGESNFTPYCSGSQLVTWFNPYGFSDRHPNSVNEIGSRAKYALDRVEKINKDPEKMKRFLESLVDSRRFMNFPNLDITKAVEYINTVLKKDKLLLKESVDGYRLCSFDDSLYDTEVKAVFEEIQSRILDQIKSAEFLIWVAVAWFTDPILFNALSERRESGISVKVILIDDDINRKSKLCFKSFPVKWISPDSKYKNLMHHKFCVIDLKKVIHGSYNWTKKAKFNQESISVTEDKAFAEDFARTFVQLAATKPNNF